MNTRDAEDNTVLMVCMKRVKPGALELMDTILNAMNKAVPPGDLNARNAVGETALSIATSTGKVDVVRKLMKAGANALAPTGIVTSGNTTGVANGPSPVQTAIYKANESPEMAMLLLETLSPEMKAELKKDKKMFQAALRGGATELTEELCKPDGKKNEPDFIDGLPKLWWAAHWGNAKVLQFADDDRAACKWTKDKRNILHWIALWRQDLLRDNIKEIVKKLVDNGTSN